MKSPAEFSTLCAKSVAVFVAHAALQDVEHHLEAVVNVRRGDPAGRDRRDVHRQRVGADVLSRHPELVADAVPLPAIGAAADHRDAAELLDVLPGRHAPTVRPAGVSEYIRHPTYAAAG